MVEQQVSAISHNHKQVKSVKSVKQKWLWSFKAALVENLSHQEHPPLVFEEEPLERHANTEMLIFFSR